MIFKKLLKLLTEKENSVSQKKLEKLKNKNRKQEARLLEISKNNNTGIELEKAGEIDEAIQMYEQNVANRVVATHSYDRLMIIYRKRKEYQDEIRIIKIAIEVFADENDLRYHRAMEKAPTSDLKKIEAGHLQCEKVKGLDRWIIYNPYPVNKYKQRLQQAIKLGTTKP